jgi:transposase
MLEYKAESANTLFRKVIPHGTSQRCSRCGNIVKKTLAIRTHCCLYCTLNIDRDYNASINILQNGLNSLLRESKEVTPAAIEPIQIISNDDLQVRSMNQEATELIR